MPSLPIAQTMRAIDERARYDAWWRSGPGQPCEVCKQGNSIDAAQIRMQGDSFFPMRVFGPDKHDRTVRYLLVAMEPSVGWFDGFSHRNKGRDPTQSMNLSGAKPGTDGVTQYAAREWLCDEGETFLMTDVAKCPAKDPFPTRSYRWKNCDRFLQEEARLFPVRAVIAVGREVRDALRERPWLNSRPLFRVLHWSGVSVANHEKVYRMLTEAEQRVTDTTVEKYRTFVNERRVSTGKMPERDIPVTSRTRTLLAVYRKQFGCIKHNLSDPSWTCERRGDGTCCRAVPRRHGHGHDDFVHPRS